MPVNNHSDDNFLVNTGFQLKNGIEDKFKLFNHLSPSSEYQLHTNFTSLPNTGTNGLYTLSYRGEITGALSFSFTTSSRKLLEIEINRFEIIESFRDLGLGKEFLKLTFNEFLGTCWENDVKAIIISTKIIASNTVTIGLAKNYLKFDGAIAKENMPLINKYASLLAMSNADK